MRNSFLTLLLLGIILSNLDATNTPENTKYLKSYTLIKTIQKAEIDAFRKEKKVPKTLIPVDYDVKIYEIIYNSTYADGSPVLASGLYFMPVGAQNEVPLVSYHHGTLIKKEREIGFWREQNFCIGFATGGYAVARPDYHGLGKGERRHLYCHAESEAQAVLDMLRAVKELNIINKDKVSNKLFLTGYSQGGHTTMAVHKSIQESYQEEFELVASAPMSGPYDLAGMQSGIIHKEYSHPSYLPYLLYGYQEAYGLFDNINDAFVAPYDTLLTELYSGEHTLKYINTLLPSIPKHILNSQLVNDFENNNNSSINKLLVENSVYDWAPQRPVMLCYCKKDEQVNYKNAKIAYKTMKNNGSNLIRKRNAAKNLGHVPCAYVSVMYVRLYFDSFLKKIVKGKKLPKNGHQGDWGKRILLDFGKFLAKKE